MALTRDEFMELFNQGYSVAQIVDTERGMRDATEAPPAPPLGPHGESGFAYPGSPDEGLGRDAFSPVDIGMLFFNPAAGIASRSLPAAVSSSVGSMAARGAGTAAAAGARKLSGPVAEWLGESAASVARGGVKGMVGRKGFGSLSKALMKRFGKPKPRVRATPKPKPSPKPAAKPQPKAGVTQNKSPIRQRGATKAQLEHRGKDLAERAAARGAAPAEGSRSVAAQIREVSNMTGLSMRQRSMVMQAIREGRGEEAIFEVKQALGL